MAIIRSKIARQLLAEGGLPRKGFMFGSPGSAEQEASFGAQAAGGYGDYGSMDQEGQAEFDQAQFDAGVRSQSFRDMQDTNDDRGFIDTTRSNLIKGFLDRSASSNFLGSLGIGKGKGNIKDLLDKVRRGETEDLTTSQLNLANKLSKAGITAMTDVTGMSQRMFNTLFPGPPKGEGGDSEPMKKLKAPITEKIEEKPKSEFEDVLKFYGAKFKDGGEVRQNYGLGSIVKKATRAVKKVAKSPIGKAALFAGIGAYGLGVGPFSSGKFGAGFLKGPLAKKLFLSDPTKGFALANINPYTAILGTSLAAGLLSKEDEEDEKLPTQAQSDPEFQKYLAFYGGPRRFAEGGGDINEAPIKMASHEGNTQLLEQLYEDFLDLGFSPEDAARKAKEEFDNMSKKQDMPRQEMASYGYNDAMSDTYDMFLQMKEKQLIPPEMDFQEFLQEVVPEMSKKQGIERMMAAEGGMMDLGGNEMDLRGGGFVPLGAKEKADDVPARLSKNEFVFTADAVRAAGGGSVDKGADVMYKTMKTLENKVA